MIKVDRMKLAKSQGDGTYHIGSQVMDDIKEGYAVALNTTTFDVGLVIITKNESMNYQGHPVKHYGVWNNEGTTYLDLVVIIEDLETAKKLGAEEKQKAIWDFANGCEVLMSICADCSNNFQDKQCLETSNSDTPFSDTELMGITKTMIACGYYNKEVAK